MTQITQQHYRNVENNLVLPKIMMESSWCRGFLIQGNDSRNGKCRNNNKIPKSNECPQNPKQNWVKPTRAILAKLGESCSTGSSKKSLFPGPSKSLELFECRDMRSDLLDEVNSDVQSDVGVVSATTPSETNLLSNPYDMWFGLNLNSGKSFCLPPKRVRFKRKRGKKRTPYHPKDVVSYADLDDQPINKTQHVQTILAKSRGIQK